MKRSRGLLFSSLLTLILITPYIGSAQSDILNQEENLWLASRNKTIVVYPIENAPPYSYKNSAGNPQGLAIDYLERPDPNLQPQLGPQAPSPLKHTRKWGRNGSAGKCGT